MEAMCQPIRELPPNYNTDPDFLCFHYKAGLRVTNNPIAMACSAMLARVAGCHSVHGPKWHLVPKATLLQSPNVDKPRAAGCAGRSLPQAVCARLGSMPLVSGGPRGRRSLRYGVEHSSCEEVYIPLIGLPFCGMPCGSTHGTHCTPHAAQRIILLVAAERSV